MLKIGNKKGRTKTALHSQLKALLINTPKPTRQVKSMPGPIATRLSTENIFRVCLSLFLCPVFGPWFP